MGKSLLNPDERDRFDAYGYKDHDEIYFNQLVDEDVKWQFEDVKGWFKQSDDDTDDMGFNYTFEDFGIVNGDWHKTIENFKLLQQQQQKQRGQNGEIVKYKMVFLARHGEGFHNVANAKHKQDWATKWRFLGTDGEITWGPDPDLSNLGKNQAMENNQFLLQQIDKGMPIPSKFYVSPLKRSIKTLFIEWDGIDIPQPIVNEKVRETIGINLCHKRSTKTKMSHEFNKLIFPPEFPENDDIFNSFKVREEFYQQFLRINHFLQDVFNNDDNHDIISVTCHAGTIRAFMTVIKHRSFTIPTGGMIPIVIKATSKSL